MSTDGKPSTASKASNRPTLERQVHTKALGQDNGTIFELFSDARANALPITKAANHKEFMQFFSWGDPDHDPQEKQTAKVSLSTLLSYSTRKEKWLMAFGIFMVRLRLSLNPCLLGILLNLLSSSL